MWKLFKPCILKKGTAFECKTINKHTIMKQLIFTLSVLLTTTVLLGNDKKEVTSTIDEVIVYSSGAEVFREGSITLESGVHELKFPELSQYLNPNSIQVKGRGDFTILSVNHGYDYLRNRPVPAYIKEVKDSIEWAKEENIKFGNEKSAYVSERDLVLKNQQVGAQNQGVRAEDLEQLANFYRKRLIEINKKISDLNRKEKEMAETIAKLNQQLNEWNVKLNQRYGEIYVTVMVNARTNAKLEVQYLVTAAGWTPRYNIRSNGAGSDLKIDYMADVHQNSGEDWNSVKMKVSTGSPMNNATKPEMHPWVLHFMQDMRLRAASYSNRAYALNEVTVTEDAESVYKEEKIAKSTSDFTNVMEGQLAVTFDIAIPYTIPSDGKQRTVKVQELTLPAKYEYYAAPKLTQKAFLVGKITDWNQYNLMPGEANIFFEGGFVSKTYLNTFTTNDTLNIALGQDDRINLSRKRVHDFSKESFGNKVETIGLELQVKNNKNAPVEIVIQDQYPISSDKEINVELNQNGNSYVNDKTGLLTWRFTLQPGEMKKMDFTYTVKYPKDKKVNL
tara:strand:+ start:10561 stop:12240 length:1680 start_codon:yes stop_codon:yes gene_type:complete